MQAIQRFLKFPIGLVANILSDLAQIEHAVPAFTGVLSAMTLWSGKFGTAGTIGSSIGIVGSGVAVALPHIGAGIKQVETDLQTLLRFAGGDSSAPSAATAGSSVNDIISEFGKAYDAIKALEQHIAKNVASAPASPVASPPAEPSYTGTPIPS